MSEQDSQEENVDEATDAEENIAQEKKPKEYGGPRGKEPTRYGDWEKNGRCIDF